jgi:hypothetical protein
MPAAKSAAKSAAKVPTARKATTAKTATRKPASKSSPTTRKTTTAGRKTTTARKATAPRKTPTVGTNASTRAASTPETATHGGVVVQRQMAVPQQRQYADPRLSAPVAYAQAPTLQPIAQYSNAPVKVCPNCKAQAQTAEPKCPYCRKKYAKKKRTVLKVFLGVFAALMTMIILIVVMVGAAANKAVNDLNAEQKAHAISPAKFSSIKLHTTKSAVLRAARPATPEDTQEFEDAGVLNASDIKSSCVYFNKAGGSFGDVYQFCFDGNKLTSKNSF